MTSFHFEQGVRSKNTQLKKKNNSTFVHNIVFRMLLDSQITTVLFVKVSSVWVVHLQANSLKTNHFITCNMDGPGLGVKQGQQLSPVGSSTFCTYYLFRIED